MTPIIPFLFVPTALALSRLRRAPVFALAILAVAQAWSLAMYREVESSLGVLDPLIKTLVEGFQLPVLRTIARTGGSYGGLGEHGVSPLPLFILAGTIVFGLWTVGVAKDDDDRS